MMKLTRKKLARLALLAAGLILAVGLLERAAGLIWPFPQERLAIYKASPRVLDSKGVNMLSLVSEEQQWCFPLSHEQISANVIAATVAVEDKGFYRHSGVDNLAMARALWQNVTSGKVVSGASTITMQVCRMMENRPRTLVSKIVEIFRARQLERIRTKDEILDIYLSYAPYGGNIRGIEAASEFYFSRHASELSLAQAAFLAGLPKSPTRYNPARHKELAIERQQFVLAEMLDNGSVSPGQYQQALAEDITIARHSATQRPSHAAWLALSRNKAGGKTTIDSELQGKVESLCQQYAREVSPDSEVAVVVIDIERSAIVAMLGSADINDPIDGLVNGAVARRSPGSALKPFIYAQAFEQGQLAPDSTVYDVPISIAGWTPSNFAREFCGELPADQALRKSLNIPAIWIARHVGVANCYDVLDRLGFGLPADAQQRCGLAMVVGGCEVSLLALTNAYAVFGRGGVYSSPGLLDEPISSRPVYSQAVCDNINHILSSRARVPAGLDNIEAGNIPWFMWKTGTSSGRRDAWAVGHNYRYAIGVWIGRFGGGGRYEYVGGQAAEPLLARLFCLPVFAGGNEPDLIASIKVNSPMPTPVSLSEQLQIIYPENGETFIAYDGPVDISPQANRSGELFWFLNDELLTGPAMQLKLAQGEYQLRCLDSNGVSDTTNFVVKSSVIVNGYGNK